MAKTAAALPRVIDTAGAPAAIGPYAQGTVAGGLIFTSMQLPLPAGGTPLLPDAPIETQTRQVLENLLAIVTAGGGALRTMAKLTIYLADPADAASMNSAYAGFFGDVRPARSLVIAAEIPRGYKVAAEAVASLL